MAKVSTTLQNIEYIKDQEYQQELTKEEEQKEKKKYNNFINETIQEEIQQEFLQSKDIEATYKNIILENDLLNKIIKEIDEEAQKHYKIITSYIYNKEKNPKDWTRKKEIIYLWDDFINYNDIRKLFYNILEEIYKQEQKKENIKNEIVLQRLENYFIYNYNNHLYTSCNILFYNYNTIKKVIDEIALNKREEREIQQNYYKILNKIDNIFKKQQGSNTKKKKNNCILYIGAGLYGIFKGIKNATK